MTDPMPIKVLVASSTEARTIARDLRTRLPEHWSTALWDEGVIKPGQGAWTGLIEVCRAVDVVVLLLTADDVLEHRGQLVAVPRDNVVFEAGLCMGLLGAERTLLVQQQDLELRLPSDLAGLGLGEHLDRASAGVAQRDDGGRSNAPSRASARGSPTSRAGGGEVGAVSQKG